MNLSKRGFRLQTRAREAAFESKARRGPATARGPPGTSGAGVVRHPEAEHLELLVGRGQGRAGHQVGGALRLREGDDLAYVALAGEEGDNAVEAVTEAAVGWRPVLEGLQHVPEAAPGVLGRDL